MLTYAQNFEDVMLARLFVEQQTGFYIDVGACHPENLSVTKHFYDLGWKGINIEPIPKACRLFDKSRPRDINLNAAIDVGSGQRVFYEVREFDALSTFDVEQAVFLRKGGYHLVEYPVKTLTLNCVFEKYVSKTVDFLKIDVEGSEDLVLRSINLSQYRPRVLVIEAMKPARDFPGWGNHDLVSNWEWESSVISQGYIFAHYDGISRFYIRLEDKALVKRLELPPGCFDKIHQPSEIHLTQQLEQATHQLDQATHQLEESKHQLQVATSEIAMLNQQLSGLASLGVRGRVNYLVDYIKLRCKHAIKRKWFHNAGVRETIPLPKITVVTPVLNGAEHIEETLYSVLCQDYPDLEYIVVDGGSTDGTMDILQQFQGRADLPQRISLVISEPDGGMYDAIAKGLEKASGDILCYLNSDDLLECNGLRSVGLYFALNPKAQVIYHEDIVLLDGWKYPNVWQPKGVSTLDLLYKHILFQDGVFWRRHAYEAVGGIRRSLRLSGDFDLWLRMSARFKFVKRPGHVSCFRVRDGQLSGQLNQYHVEMEQSINDFLLGCQRWKRISYATQKALQSLVRPVTRRLFKRRKSRLFFPFDSKDMPTSPSSPWSQQLSITTYPKSPIDGKPAERFLFTTPDTRFGDPELNYVYFDARHEIAIAHPPISADKLDSLYRKYYSSPPTDITLPLGRSPYRHYNNMRFWERALFRLPAEALVHFLPNAWADKTLLELHRVLTASKVTTGEKLRFLDTGCFEGHLLDQIRDKTSWQAFGLEPNDSAVEVARSKGHQVWHCHAEQAAEIIPDNQQFDVVYMGQSIEHMDDPVSVLRRLRLMLAPSGVLVMSTPNLDSREIDWFGPTWAHWHAPYHRYIFSRRGLNALAWQVGMLPVHYETFSHPYWTTMSLAQNSMGLAGSASHAVNFDRKYTKLAQRIYFWHVLFWNRLGKGDYCFISLKDGSYE